jgi:hypothetical protein
LKGGDTGTFLLFKAICVSFVALSANNELRVLVLFEMSLVACENALTSTNNKGFVNGKKNLVKNLRGK